MTRARHPWGYCAAVVAVAVGLSGCSLIGNSEDDQSSAKTVAVPVEVPVTFDARARWDAALVPGTRPVELEEGIAVIQPGPGESTYRVALVSPYDGKRKWISKAFTNPTPDEPPKVSETTVDGDSWVLVETQTGENEVTLDAYSPRGTGDRREPQSSGTFTGTDDKTIPEVNVGDEGIVVHYSANPEHAKWQADVKKLKAAHAKKLKKAKKAKKKMASKPKLPPKPGPAVGSMTFDPEEGKSSVYKGAGTIRSVWSEGNVVTDPSDTSGFGFVVDNKPAWESSEVRPPQAEYKSAGSLAATGPGVLIGRWPGKDGKPLLAVHEIRTGKVIATLDELNAKTVADAEGGEVTASNDGEWAAWGPFVFGLKGKDSTRVMLRHGTVSAIHGDVLYVRDANSPMTASSAKVTPASEGDDSSSDGSKSKYRGMVDIGTGHPLTNTKPETVPLFVSSASQGVFVVPKGGKTRLYSNALS